MLNGKDTKTVFSGLATFLYAPAVALSGGLLCRFVPESGQWLVSLFLLLLSIVSYLFYARIGCCLVDLRALLSLSWLAGLGIANLRLSNMHSPWTDHSVLCFFGFYALTMLGYETCMCFPKKNEEDISGPKEESKTGHVLYRLILITAAVSFLCFCLEVIILGYIPLFDTRTHAYNWFHVTGLHYFTFSSMFTHALTILYLLQVKKENRTRKQKRIIWTANLLSILIPVLCISKLQFLLIFFYPVVILLLLLRFRKFSDLPVKKIAIVVCGMVFVFMLALIVFTARRNYPEGYLDQIYDMKASGTPEIGQILYMYTSNNYANFNHMTLTLTEHSGGLRMAFPIVALTGMKFVIPSLVPPDPLLIKPELSTLTLIYDAYYDFGVGGVFLFSAALGVLLAGITRLKDRKHKTNPIVLLMYAEISLYVTLSFFDTWFSNPTCWFWFAVTMLMYIYVEYQRRKGNGKS